MLGLAPEIFYRMKFVCLENMRNLNKPEVIFLKIMRCNS
jgi:hypothetical protein